MGCLVCGSSAMAGWLDMGEHSVASFFLIEQGAPERTHNLSLCQCGTCGTIQLARPLPHEALVPPHLGLPSREPEDHLDAVVDRLATLPGLGRDSIIAALTYKDDSTLERFRAKGFGRIWRLCPQRDLGIETPTAGIETVQHRVTPESMREVAARRGQADLLIARHVVEHAEDVRAFIHGLSELVRPGGFLMLEAPDCGASLRSHDYCMVWEEHTLYLTPEIFPPLVTLGGFEPVRLDSHPFAFENCMVLLSRKVGAPRAARLDPAARAQIGLLEGYAAALEPARQALRQRLARFRAGCGPIALFGAGHLAHAFVNFMGVGDLIEFVADDTSEKQGKFLPGARLPILPSSELVARGVRLCLLAISITSEEAVIGRNAAFERTGGQFRSVLRASLRSIFAEGAIP